MNLYRVFYPASAQYTFFSQAHGILSKIDETTNQILENMETLK
jgi:hypothetical protein